MKVFKSSLIFLLLSSLVIFLAYNYSLSEENETIELSLDDCINIALENNFSLYEKKLNLIVLYRTLEEKKRGMYPVVSFRAFNQSLIKSSILTMPIVSSE